MYFNSIKVQLELIVPVHTPQKVLFQFHKGTIRTDKSTDIGDYSDISIP